MSSSVPKRPVARRRARGALLAALCACCAGAGAAASDAQVRSAGCYIALPHGVVVTVGRFNGAGALQLPGGTRKSGETPVCTAQRETYEETGLVVDVAERLATRNHGRFVLFRCVPRAPLREDARLAAPDFFEVREVLILDPLTLRTPAGVRYANRWRFPRDLELLRALFGRAEQAPARRQAHEPCRLKLPREDAP